MFMLSQISRFHGPWSCLTAIGSRIMFNSTTTGRWPVPRYFEYDIVAGPGDSVSEWIGVYMPGPWQPVADFTLGPAPGLPSTYREWHKFYIFEVYWPCDSTGGTP